MADETDKPSAARGKTLEQTLLVVDDEEDVRDSIGAALRGHGYDVLVASSGKEAVLLIREHGDRIRLMLTDIRMPEMNGHELARRASKALPDLEVIFMSGSAPDVADPGMRFVQKPATPSELIRRIRIALGESDGPSLRR